MADDTFRPRRPQNPSDYDDEDDNEGLEALRMSEQLRQQAAREVDREDDSPSALGNLNIKGPIPPEFMKALKAVKNGPQKIEREPSTQEPKRGFGEMHGGGDAFDENAPMPVPVKKERQAPAASSGHLRELLEGLKGTSTTYEEVELPSRGRFYDDTDGPANGILSIRPMTGEEEQILATPRFVKKGQAINMIFQKCIKEQFRPEQLLTIDRTYLLIYLRGISYSPDYDVEIKCPECEKKFWNNH